MAIIQRPPDTPPTIPPTGLFAHAISLNQVDLIWTASTDTSASVVATYCERYDILRPAASVAIANLAVLEDDCRHQPDRVCTGAGARVWSRPLGWDLILRQELHVRCV